MTDDSKTEALEALESGPMEPYTPPPPRVETLKPPGVNYVKPIKRVLGLDERNPKEPYKYGVGTSWVKHLNDAMYAYNLTQKDMAAKLGTSETQMHRWMVGKHKPIKKWLDLIYKTFPLPKES